MPQPEPHPDYDPRFSRRVLEPSPIINLPVNAIINEVDPTRELRTLIEELQRTVRESREKATESDRDREQMTRQLENATLELRESRTRESEMRSRFLEITTLIKERDDAVAAREEQARALAELQSQLKQAERESDSLSRQRELAHMQFEALTRSASTTAAQLAQTQNLIISIRQARDSTQSQNRELTLKLERAEDQIAELTYERESQIDQDQRRDSSGEEEISRLRGQVESLTSDRHELRTQLDTLQGEFELSRQKTAELGEAHLNREAEQSAALASAREELSQSAAERDAARVCIEQLDAELKAVHERVAELLEKDAAQAGLPAALDAASQEIRALSGEREARLSLEQSYLHRQESHEERLKELSLELAQTRLAHQSLGEALAVAEARSTALGQERENLAQLHRDQIRALEIQTAALKARDAHFDEALSDARQLCADQEEKLRSIHRLAEEHRLVAIDLAARFDTAQREIIELTANLAETRLQAKSASKRGKQPALPPPQNVPEKAPLHDSEETAEGVFATLTEKDFRNAINAMRRCQQGFEKTPDDLSLLNELYCQAANLSERAQISGLVALYRVTEAIANFTRHLYEIPESLNDSTVRTLRQSLEFLGQMTRDRNLVHLIDPIKARVYVVEDDPDTYDIIALAFELVQLEAVYCAEPFAALDQLTREVFDLVVLDVDLPGMTGFELCEHLRELEVYAKKPVLFLTGLNTPDYEAQAHRHGGTDFIAKPFNLHEFALKALLHILRAHVPQ